MSTDAHRRRTPHPSPLTTSPDRTNAPHEGPGAAPDVRAAGPASLFSRANPFLELLWEADTRGLCMSFGCTECGALGFRRELAHLEGDPDADRVNSPTHPPRTAPGPLATALASIDFDLLRLAPHWYDALDIALLRLRDRGELAHVVDAWLARNRVPVRVLDLVLFRHARYGFPDHRLADHWIERCLDSMAATQDEGLVETMILSCPERIGADPRAFTAAVEAARHSPCVRSLLGRLGDCA